MSDEDREFVDLVADMGRHARAEFVPPLWHLTPGIGEALALAELGAERWLQAWYGFVCSLPAAHGCDATLVVQADSVILRQGHELVGLCDLRANRITVAALPIPSTMIATLAHEVAHHAARPARHGRMHGYAWRRTFAALLEQITGVTRVEARAEAWRRRHGWRWEPRPSRENALDMVAEQILGWTSLTLANDLIVIQTPIHVYAAAR